MGNLVNEQATEDDEEDDEEDSNGEDDDDCGEPAAHVIGQPFHCRFHGDRCEPSHEDSEDDRAAVVDHEVQQEGDCE
ncbi:MAG TPA: hypothetical protein DCQ04_12090 [Actinobacteria bacterium]|nr:hypothetical protein [Actinomycetota bacterium]